MHQPLKTSLGLLMFWAAMFLLNAGPHWETYSSTRELIETAGSLTILQTLIALICIKILVPRFLEKKRWLSLFLSVTVLVILIAEINIFLRYVYLEPRYPASYQAFLNMIGDRDLFQRLDLTWTLRYIIFTKAPTLLSPTLVLVAYNFYSKKEVLLKQTEQKKIAELNALKQQLNPHFLFNTLNNIYALTLKKSDQAPVAVEKLSAILDYVVYRSGSNYVDLKDEIALVENYISLEKIRYGDRLDFTLKNTLLRSKKIAPLIMLNLLENACKHSMREELHTASIEVELQESEHKLMILVRNSKPRKLDTNHLNKDKNQIGLLNLHKQLELLYPGNHEFHTSEDDQYYTVQLMLPIMT